MKGNVALHLSSAEHACEMRMMISPHITNALHVSVFTFKFYSAIAHMLAHRNADLRWLSNCDTCPAITSEISRSYIQRACGLCLGWPHMGSTWKHRDTAHLGPRWEPRLCPSGTHMGVTSGKLQNQRVSISYNSTGVRISPFTLSHRIL